MDTVLTWLLHYGYAGLFALLALGVVGLPIPDETLLAFSGFLISRGKFDARWTFACGFGGSVCGISLSYLIGRTAGQKAAHRYGKYVHLTPERLAHVHRWFDRIGEWLLMIGYFIPGVRHFTALVAGMSEVKYARFAAFAYTGAAIWVGTFLAIGYFVGENWPAVLQAVQHYTALSAAFFVLAAALIWWVRRKRGVRAS